MRRRARRSRAAFLAAACLTASTAARAEDVVVVPGFQVIEGGGVAVVPAEVLAAPDDGLDPEIVNLDVEVAQPAGPNAGGGLLGLGFRAMLNAIAPGPNQQQPIPVDEAADGEMPKDPGAAQQWQQRKQIRQQAKNLEQLFQPFLRTELEVIRQACPDLSIEARREVLAAGKSAVTKTALEFATRQMLGGQPKRTFDARQTIQTSMGRALEPHATPELLEGYTREQARRLARRSTAARVVIVAKLDRQLDLTNAQRQAIEDDLEARWDDSWLRELDDTGMMINGFRPAPDYANGCIEPHLDDGQRAEWQRWRQAAGVAVIGMHFGWNFDGQGLQQDDDWWTP